MVHMYRKDVRGFLPELMEKIYEDRTIYKKKMLEAKQQYEKKKNKTVGEGDRQVQQYPNGTEDPT